MPPSEAQPVSWRYDTMPRPPGAAPGAGGTFDDPGLHWLHPAAEALFDYWASKRQGERLPSRADIDPLEMRLLLPYVIMLDVVTGAAGSHRYRFRLVGTEVASLHTTSLTGRFVDEVLPPAALDRYRWVADRVVETRAPLRNVGRIQLLQHDWLVAEVAAMPLVEADAVAIVFAGSVTWPENDPPEPVRRRWRTAAGR